jgi:DNA-binding MarR family transcriptional regulator
MAAQLTPATVTQMLDHLAASGHVRRTRSSTDRRVVVTALTAQGEEKVRAKRTLWQQRWKRSWPTSTPRICASLPVSWSA